MSVWKEKPENGENSKTQPALMDNSFRFVMAEKPLHFYNGHAKMIVKMHHTKWVRPDNVGRYLNACHLQA